MSKQLLQVYILTGDEPRPNRDFLRIFTEEKGFDEPIFMATQYPSKEWMDKVGLKAPSKRSAIQLYNQYIIWIQAVQQGRPVVILDNGAFPALSSDRMTGSLILAGADKEADIVYYGKYLDDCQKYAYKSSVILSDGDKEYSFALFSTQNPYGAFAYRITPKGATKCIENLNNNLMGPSEFLNRLVSKKILEAWVYHPSIIRVFDANDESVCYECREPPIEENCMTLGSVFWYVLVFIIIAIFIAVILYMVSLSIVYNPDQEVSSGF